MGWFALKRGLSALITLWLLLSLVFVIVRLTGDPTMMLEGVDPQFAQTLKARWGLDKPYPVQYALFLANLAQGDFGVSYHQGKDRVLLAERANLGGTCTNLDSPVLCVGGAADHVHTLCRLGRKISVADLVKELKRD